MAVLSALNDASFVDIIKKHEHPYYKNKDYLDETQLSKPKNFHPK